MSENYDEDDVNDDGDNVDGDDDVDDGDDGDDDDDIDGDGDVMAIFMMKVISYIISYIKIDGWDAI